LDNEHLIEDNVIEYNNLCFDFSLQLLSETFLTERNMIKTRIGLHVKQPLLTSVINKTITYPKDFRKTPNYQIFENPFSGNPVAPRGWKDGREDRQIDRQT